MKLFKTISMLALLIFVAPRVNAVLLTFDDIPDGVVYPGVYYSMQYGIGIDEAFYAADHTGCTWGPPHSGKSVLAWSYPGWYRNWYGFLLKNSSGGFQARYVDGYFSTEPGVMLQMIGYYKSTLDAPVATALIGSSEGSWNNVYVSIGAKKGIGILEFRPVTANALDHFCVDDMTVAIEPVPEPSSLLPLLTGIAGISSIALRRRR